MTAETAAPDTLADAAPSAPPRKRRGAASPVREFDLATLLANRRWESHRLPFPHFAARDVFVSGFHAELAAAYYEVLARGVSETDDPQRLSRRIAGYDAYSLGVRASPDSPFGVFMSREWCTMLARLCNVATTPDLQITLHHHPVGSETGWVHNDLNPGWFVDRMPATGMNLSDNARCSYYSGRTRDGTTPVRETVRAVAMLYYVANAEWAPGDGGETGLYRSKRQPVDAPDKRAVPRNNSLIAFECTPFSYHTFLSNPNHPRNSIILWLHRPVADAIARWGEKSIVRWKKQ
jgi:hypothetical protein